MYSVEHVSNVCSMGHMYITCDMRDMDVTCEQMMVLIHVMNESYSRTTDHAESFIHKQLCVYLLMTE